MFCRKERSDLIRKGRMEIEFLNPDKTANVKKSVILFFEV